MSGFLRHLTFARVMSMVAIFIALGAGAYAARLKESSVKSRQIKDGSVRTQDFADNAVTGDKVLHGSVTSLQIANDSVTGDSIDESTLQVPSAASTERVGGLKVEKLNVSLAPTESRLIDFGGKFQLSALCSSVGVLAMGSVTKVSNSLVQWTGIRAAGANDLDGARDIGSNVDPDFDEGDFFVFDLADADRLYQSNVRYRSADGFVVVTKFLTLDVGGRCHIWGTAVSG